VRRRNTIRLAATAVCALAALLPQTASAAPACVNPPQAETIYSGYGILESVIVDQQGRLYFTDTDNDQILRADAPGMTPYTFATGIPAAGGMTFLPDGDLIVGTGDAIATGLFGPISPSAGLIRIDPDTAAKTPYASGLQMANGVEIGPGGEIYASADVVLANGIDRVGPGGTPVEAQWADVASANGLVVDSAGQFLYAAQTFQPAAIKRVTLTDPPQVETFVQAPPADIAGGPDGMTRDENDQLYVAANGGGQIWKVTNPGREICSLASMAAFPDGPSAVAFGKGPTGFSGANLYAVTFGGEVIELRGARAAAPASPSSANAQVVYGTSARKRKCKKRHRKKAQHSKRKRCKRKHKHPKR
jgi:sugar lactone lactonase YvrE